MLPKLFVFTDSADTEQCVKLLALHLPTCSEVWIGGGLKQSTIAAAAGSRARFMYTREGHVLIRSAAGNSIGLFWKHTPDSVAGVCYEAAADDFQAFHPDGLIVVCRKDDRDHAVFIDDLVTRAEIKLEDHRG